jgi:hypothetical protein
VISIGECLNYLFDRRNNRQQRTKLFRRISRALNPGGIFVFDVATSRSAPGRTPSAPTPKVRKVFSVGKDWVIAAEIIKEGDQLLRNIVSARKIDKDFRLHHEIHRQVLFDPHTLKRELINAGFRVKLLRGSDPGHCGFICH